MIWHRVALYTTALSIMSVALVTGIPAVVGGAAVAAFLVLLHGD